MKELLKGQTLSKASKFCKVIRESMEFSKEYSQNIDDKDEDDEDDVSQDDYEFIKNDVLRII